VGKKDKKKKKEHAESAVDPVGSGPGLPGEVGEDVEEMESIEALTSDLDLPSKKQIKKQQLRELAKLQIELVKLQEWVRTQGLRVVVLFEGRDAAGKGGTISAIQMGMNPRTVHTVALPAPSPRERSLWYFQRYAEQLPAGGEMILFDRSWYNRAGVEPVMGFCTRDEHRRFLRECPKFEEMLIDDGIYLRKYYLSVSQEEQHRRFEARANNPTKRWKVSPVDLAAVDRFDEYTEAKETMFAATHTEKSPWFVVDSNDKRSARLNLIAHLLSTLPYGGVELPTIEIPPVPKDRKGPRKKPNTPVIVDQKYRSERI